MNNTQNQKTKPINDHKPMLMHPAMHPRTLAGRTQLSTQRHVCVSRRMTVMARLYKSAAAGSTILGSTWEKMRRAAIELSGGASPGGFLARRYPTGDRPYNFSRGFFVLSAFRLAQPEIESRETRKTEKENCQKE